MLRPRDRCGVLTQARRLSSDVTILKQIEGFGGEEGFHDDRVELSTRLSLDFNAGHFGVPRGLIGSFARQGVEDVGNGYDARFNRYLISTETVRVASSIESFVVACCDSLGHLQQWSLPFG